ncbi:MAG: DNA polymerase Y family protein, partial [Alphaproteobacteria bacterium]
VATRLDQALGTLAEPVMPQAPAPERRVRLAFAEPILTAEPIAAAARRLLDDLCARLALDGTGAVRLVLELFRVDADVQRIAVGTARPSRSPDHLFRLLAERLPGVEPGFGIETMMLSLVESAPLAAEQAGRLDVVVPDAPASGRRAVKDDVGTGAVLAMAAELAPLVDRIQNRFGFSAIHRPAPRASHVPERAVAALAPFAPDPPAAAAWPAGRAPRPLRLLRRPEPVEATAPVPDDPPVQFRWRAALHRVRRADGPERIAAEWWREEGGVRDYYRVEDEAGRRFWLFRSGLHGDEREPRWFLHGFFA